MTLFRIVIFNYGISLNNVYGLIYEVFTAGDGGIHTHMWKFKTGTIEKNLSSTICRSYFYLRAAFILNFVTWIINLLFNSNS